MTILSFDAPFSNCPVCASADLEAGFLLDFMDITLRWSHCRACDLTFQNPRLSEESIRWCYANTDYWGEKGGSAHAAYSQYLAFERLRLQDSRRRLRVIGKIAGKTTGNLLDIGSATGFTGCAAKEAGFSVTCLEPSEEMAAYGKVTYGLAYIVDTFESAALPRNAYDVVTLFGTDSHFLDPFESFKKLASILKEGGVVALTYQDFSHAIRRLFPGIKQSWNAIYNLSDRSFVHLMDKAGLEVIYFRPFEWRMTHVSHVLLTAGLPLPGFVHRSPWLILPVPSISYRFVIVRRRTNDGPPARLRSA